MKILPLLLLVALVGVARGQTPAPKPFSRPVVAPASVAPDLTTLSGHTYRQARVFRVEPDGINYVFAGGMVKVPFTDLPEEIGEKYGYDPKKAAAFAASDAKAQEKAFESAQKLGNADRQRKLNQLAGTASSIVTPTEGEAKAATSATAIIDPDWQGGLKRIMKMPVNQLAVSPFSAKGAIVELTDIREVDFKEISLGIYRITIYPKNGYNTLNATLPRRQAELAEKSQVLFVSVTNPEESEVTVHGNATTYKALSTMPTVIWAAP